MVDKLHAAAWTIFGGPFTPNTEGLAHAQLMVSQS